MNRMDCGLAKANAAEWGLGWGGKDGGGAGGLIKASCTNEGVGSCVRLQFRAVSVYFKWQVWHMLTLMM